MKVLVLGAGGMGANGAKVLQHFPGIEKLTFADINFELAEKTAKELHLPAVDAIELDVNDSEKLTATAREYDVVLNTVGPYMRFAVPILKAVIAAGTDYVDVCDDHDATENMLELFDLAEEAGITAVVSMGQSPGITNMQAKYISEKFDRVDLIKVIWSLSDFPIDLVKASSQGSDFADMASASQTPEEFRDSMPAVWPHMLHTTSGEIPIWKNGKFDTMPAWESGEYIDYPEPLGLVPVYYVGHSEPVTLPRYIDIKDFCACLGTLGEGIDKLLRLEARGHEDPLDPPVKPDKERWQPPAKWDGMGIWQGGAALVEGMKDGKRVRYTNRALCSAFDRGVFNFAGQAIGVYLLGSKKDLPKGVFAPEGIFATDEFFAELLHITNKINEWDFTLEELLPTEIEILD